MVKEPLGPPVQWVLLVLEVVLQAPQDQLVHKDLRDHKDRKAPKDPRE